MRIARSQVLPLCACRDQARLVGPPPCRPLLIVSVEVSGNSPGTDSARCGSPGLQDRRIRQSTASPPSHLVQGDEGGLVGVGQGVQIFHHLQIGAAGKQPGGMGVAEVVDTHPHTDVGTLDAASQM